MSLLRSMMFKSESSIYQKYQIYLEKGHIVKIPSAICPVANVTHQKNEPPIFPPTKPTLVNPAHYVQVTSLNCMPMENVIKNVLRTTSTRMENTPCEKMFKECFCRECIYNQKYTQQHKSKQYTDEWSIYGFWKIELLQYRQCWKLILCDLELLFWF